VKPLLLRGGTLVDPSQKLNGKGDLLILDGNIEKAGGRISPPDKCEIVDCAGFIVSPGFIDVHCHLREPGRGDFETIATGARAAAAADRGAVTHYRHRAPAVGGVGRALRDHRGRS